ncbi:alanine racemase [Marivirga atlantica]|jgi:alanine racemase|uniref:Alanine racemase n=1 Tax=Marivirga atlantica TaxID=1548457 RepID=A0A937AD74_9BACT|nr:alanine racemase [Marivirga atlantica]MBL0764399.1 alanine racemase [Marivirga atlantica]
MDKLIPTRSTSTIYLNPRAAKRNVKFVKCQLKEGTLLSAVVKGNAYGHGIEQMVPIFEKSGINHFSVFSSHEAYQVCEVKSKKTEVMIMGWLNNDEIRWAIKNEVSFFVFELDRLNTALKIAQELSLQAKIHIELETGMNRTGLEEKHIPEALSILKENEEHFLLEGLCTHYAGAESITNYLRIQDQITLYKKYCSLFESEGLKPKYKHTACSAAMISYPETQMDMVRVGILLYGFWPSRETFIYHQRKNGHAKERSKDPLSRVIKWTSQVMSTKEVPMGDFIGYGTSYQAPKKMKVATVPVGYAYGFARSLSNQGRAIVNGKRVAVIGTINMNLMMINVTECKSVEKGDEVILIGSSGKVKVTVASFGELSNQLNYELLSRLPQDIPRVIE